MNFKMLAHDSAIELLQLCRAGKLYEVEAWIATGKSLLVPPEFKKTPLQIAVGNGFHSLVLLLARNEVNQKVKNDALAEATKLRNLELVRLLLTHGAEINGVPFADVLLTWEPALMRLFLDGGADVVTGFPFAEAFGNKVRTALRPFMEHKKSHSEVAGQLQEQIDRVLRYFCHIGDLKWVSLLMWAGADPRTKGPRLYERDDSECYATALESAALGDNVEVLKRLKPSPEADDFGDLLVCAAIGGNTAIIHYLLKLGANPNGKANGGSAAIDRCLWHIQIHASRHRGTISKHSIFEFYRAFDVAKVLVQQGAIWKPDDRTQILSLRKALYECEPDVTVKWLKLLVEHSAASAETLRELLATPRMREHLVRNRWWISHLKLNGLLETEAEILSRRRQLLRDRIVPRELLARYNREELYDKVWERPVQRLSKEFGMSDVGLAKICRKLFIPIPAEGIGRGRRQVRKLSLDLLCCPCRAVKLEPCAGLLKPRYLRFQFGKYVFYFH